MNHQFPRLFVFVVGQMRAAEQTFNNFRTHLLDCEETCLIVQCSKSDVEMASRTYATNYTDAWDPIPLLPFWMRHAWPKWGDSGRDAVRVKPSFYFQLVRQHRAAAIFANQVDVERDWILKWRPDLMLFGDLNWKKMIDQPAIWLPKHDNHGGFNDQMALGPAKMMLPYLRRLDRLDEYFRDNGRIHSESFLRWSLAGQAVERFSIPYCIHRGTHLNPIKIHKKYGDIEDSNLVKTFERFAVHVELDLADGHASDETGLRRLVGNLWQNAMGLGFRGAELAAQACRGGQS